MRTNKMLVVDNKSSVLFSLINRFNKNINKRKEFEEEHKVNSNDKLEAMFTITIKSYYFYNRNSHLLE